MKKKNFKNVIFIVELSKFINNYRFINYFHKFNMVVQDKNSKPVRHVKTYVYQNGPCFTLCYKKN